MAQATQIDLSVVPVIPVDTLAQANTRKKAWLSLYGLVWDVTMLLEWHPGGDEIILKYAGMKDATKFFEQFHARLILEKILGLKKIVGRLESTTAMTAQVDTESRTVAKLPWVSVKDAEEEAKLTLAETSLAYFSTGAEDEMTLQANESVFRKHSWFRPRVLVDVANVDTSRSCFGGKRVDSPLFISSTAIQGLANMELGELAAFRAAKAMNIIHIAAHLSSRPWEDYLSDRPALDASSVHSGMLIDQPKQTSNKSSPRYLQVYLPKDNDELKSVIARAERCQFEALFITVDSASIGKRERDVRTRQKMLQKSSLNVAAGEAVQPSGTAPRATTSSRWNESFNWEALKDLRRLTKLPIVLKGIQRGDDAVRAVRAGVEGIMVSNHGGRNMDTARPSLACLVEINAALKAEGLKGRVPIYFDGGVRRGSDVLKALCLGADFVGVGRPILWGVAARGEEGALEVLRILQSELITAMKLAGCATVKDAEETLVEFGVSYL